MWDAHAAYRPFRRHGPRRVSSGRGLPERPGAAQYGGPSVASGLGGSLPPPAVVASSRLVRAPYDGAGEGNPTTR